MFDPPRPARRPTARRVPALLAVLVVAALSSGCATTGGLPGAPTGDAFAAATSASCAEARGASALYWDFMNGIIRADYPETYRFLPYAPGTPFLHPQQPLYSFVHPSSWTAEMLTDPSLQLTGANVVRGDGQAVWRRLNLTLSGFWTATDVVATEIDLLLRNFGIAAPVTATCSLTAPDGSRAARLIVAGDVTANVTAQVFASSFGPGTLTTAFVQVAVAPTGQYDDTVVSVFFPLSGQMNLGGGSGTPECSDGDDNDGDGRTDYPDDPGCASEFDDDETG
jgi:hypothetical protein